MAKIVSILLPNAKHKPVGGYKIIYRYIDEICKISNSYQFHFYYINNNKRKTFKNKARYIYNKLIILFYKFIYKKFYKWASITDDKNFIQHHLTIDHKKILESYIIIVTAVETALYIRQNNLDKKKVVIYFIQGFEDWTITCKQVIETYRYGYKNIVISKWLKGILLKNNIKVALHLPNPVDSHFILQKQIINRDHKSILFLYHKNKLKGSFEAIEALIKLKFIDRNIKVSCFSVFKQPKKFPNWISYYYLPSQKKLVELYNEHRFFLSSSYLEGYGLPLAEAMACGCCVITTKSGGVADFAIHNKTAYTVDTPPNPIQIYETFLSLFKNEKLVYKLAENGKKYISKLNWQDNSNKFLELLNTSKYNKIIV